MLRPLSLMATRGALSSAAAVVVPAVVAGALYCMLRRRWLLPPEKPDLDEAAARECWPPCLTPGDGPHQLSFRTITNRQGLRIATYAIRAPEPAGAVIIVHGFRVSARFEFIGPATPGGAHTQWDGSVLSELLARGVSLYLLDLQGHGQSDSARGARAHVECFDDYAHDVLQFAREIVIPELRDLRHICPPPPLFLYGQSLGGGIVVRVSQLSAGHISGYPIHGLVCGAPLIQIGSSLPRRTVWKVRILSWLWPTRMSDWPTSLNGIDPEAYARELAHEPTHYHGGIRLQLFSEVKRVSDGFVGPSDGPLALENVHATALLTCISYADQLVEWQGAQALYERACRVRRRTLVLVKGMARTGLPDRAGAARTIADGAEPVAADRSIWSDEVLSLPLWHNLTREPQGERLARAIAEWVEGECARAAHSAMRCEV